MDRGVKLDRKMYGIAEKLLSAIKEKYNEDYTNVPEILIYWHNITFLFFTSVNHRRLFDSADVNYEKMVSLGLMPEYLYVFYENNKAEIDKHLNDALVDFYCTDHNVNNARQELLNAELDFTTDSIGMFSDKVNRDNTGAYYTPQELASETIKKAFRDKTFDIEKKCRIADFSCGSGDFFLAAMNYLQEERGIDKKISVDWFYGTDIDPIALQICVVNLLQFADRKEWKSVISHFKFGNPLVISDREYSEEEKNYLFATRRLYSIGLGMSEDFFENTFDIIVGNPPWEKIRFEERKFFKGISDHISSVSQKNIRDKAVEKLKTTWPIVFEWRNQVYNEYSNMTAANYKHCKIRVSVAGELNTYALFTELAYNMLSEHGLLSLIVKSTLVTAPVNQMLWSKFLDEKAVKNIFLFENKKKIFSIDSRERFIIFIAAKEKFDLFEFATGLTEPSELYTTDTITLNAEDLKSINPFTSTIPNVSDNREIRFLKDAHKRFSLFSDVYPNCHFGRLIHLTAHTASISKQPTKDNVPVYEGKFIEQYDARFATFQGMPESKKYANKASAEKTIPNIKGVKAWPESRFFVDQALWNKYRLQYGEKYSLCWRSLTSPTNRRTMLAMILPTCPTCQSIQMLQTTSIEELVMLLALFNSIPFDYFVRIKMPGLDLTQSVIKQIPVPSNSEYCKELEFNGKVATLKKHILSYTISILKGESKLKELIMQFDGMVYNVEEQDIEQKKKMIDLLFQKAYHLDDDSYKEILLTFPKYQANHIV